MNLFICCQTCTTRYCGCHSKCELYNADKIKFAEMKAAEREARKPSEIERYERHRNKKVRAMCSCH